MTLGDKLAKLRKENNFTQEQLANELGISRQAISKWESDLTYPETDKLIRISELFHCSLDYLLKDTVENDFEQPQTPVTEVPVFRLHLHEKKSEKMIFGMPLWHISKNARGFIAIGLRARGVIAIGLKAQGILAFGTFSAGILSLGMFSLGLLSFGLFAIGILSAGCFSMGVLTAGAICFGIISVGAVAAGDFSVGALAVGKYYALGDVAKGMIALGSSKASGTVFEKIGNLTAQEIATVKQLLDTIVPPYLSWAKDFFKLFF